MDVVVTGRHCELSERFRDHVADKLGRLEKHDHRIMRVQVEVENERNPRQADRAVRIELTAYSKGPVIRAEAAAVDKMGALDLAVDKMAAQMRRANDRQGPGPPQPPGDRRAPDARPSPTAPTTRSSPSARSASMTVTGDGPPVVREKTHARAPDDPRPGALRDGAGRARLLPLRRPGHPAAGRGLPPAGL